MDASWELISDIVVLLAAALLMGTLAEHFRYSAILGYLLAGAVVGPNALGLVGSGEEVEVIAELGVALLLFTIGLEFSVPRLLQLGSVAIVGGSLQVISTMAAAAGIAVAIGLDGRAALAVGAIVALSSTACVLRVLLDRAALESMYGRYALGILLLQDVAVIPLIVMIAALGGGESAQATGMVLVKTLLMSLGLVAVFYVVLNYVVPRLLKIRPWLRNRDLPILLSIVVAMGAVVASHKIGISPSIGAFLAGVLLGGSPFAIQIRADISSVRTLLVTVFFASIGLLADPAWMVQQWFMVVAMVAVVVVGKLAVVAAIMSLLRTTPGIACATGLCLAQVGEFSFVLAVSARGSLIEESLFSLIVSTIIVTLFATPFLVTMAPGLARWVELFRRGEGRASTAMDVAAATGDEDSSDAAIQPVAIFIIGFGPAGQRVADAMLNDFRDRIVVIDLNARNIALAQGYGLATQLGDASHRAVLEHAQIGRAAVIVITVPDPSASRTMIHHCKYLSPGAAIVARARYHVLRWELHLAGAVDVVDEEENVGLQLAAEAKKHLDHDSGK